MGKLMMARGITVTEEDLEDFRKLLRLFLVGVVKSEFKEAPAEETFLPKLLRFLDGHFFLEEPFISGQIIMQQSGADGGTLVLSDEHFEAYKAVALFDIKNNFGNVKAGTLVEPEEFQRAIDSAVITQMRLVAVLDAATHLASSEAPEQSKQPNKEFMN